MMKKFQSAVLIIFSVTSLEEKVRKEVEKSLKCRNITVEIKDSSGKWVKERGVE